ILLAVARIGDRGRIDAGADIEAPHLLQRLGVVGRKGAVEMASEHDIARSREHARIGQVRALDRRLGLAGHWIDRLHAAVALLGAARLAARKARARLERAALIDEALLLDGLD